MKELVKQFVVGALIILILNSLGAYLVNILSIQYLYIGLVIYLVYLSFGYIVGRKEKLLYAITLAASLGVVQSLIGWPLASVFGQASIGEAYQDSSIISTVINIIITAFLGGFLGLIGALIGKSINKRISKNK